MVSTYKPALLMSLIDRCQELAGQGAVRQVPVRELALRAIELYWPQTIAYRATGRVLWQNQGGKQAKIVQRLVQFRSAVGAGPRSTLPAVADGPLWTRLIDDVEHILAEMPIPRLQEPYEPFLYEFDWPSDRDGRWSVRAYRESSRAVKLFPGVLEALISLAPLMRSFIVQWWTEKAAALNAYAVPDAHAMIDFERFLFGGDRVGLTRLRSDLVDLQLGRCFYCARSPSTFEVDHFLPWSHSADDGLDNLVVACRKCNSGKRAMLPSAVHVGDWVAREHRFSSDLACIADTKHWPRDPSRTFAVARALYLRSPNERPTWECVSAGAVPRIVPVGDQRHRLEHELAAQGEGGSDQVSRR